LPDIHFKLLIDYTGLGQYYWLAKFIYRPANSKVDFSYLA